MKRIVILLVLLLLFTSCGQQNRIPSFDAYPMTLTGTLSYNGSCFAVTTLLQDRDQADITIASPENLSGYSFKVDNTGVWVYYDNMQIELHNTNIDIPFSFLPRMLDVSREDFTQYRTDSENRIYHYTKDSHSTVIYIRRTEQLPHRIEYTEDGISLVFDIENFIVQRGDTDADLQ